MDDSTDDQLLAMVGDGHLGSFDMRLRISEKPPIKPIGHLNAAIDSYVETRSREELKKIHGPRGGYVLYDHEYQKYKGYFEIAQAAKSFNTAFPELIKDGSLRYSPQEFAKLYAERKHIVEELKNFSPDKVLHEMAEPEIKEFFEYLH